MCFFYAKQMPFAEDARRILVAIGRVTKVGDPVEYQYKAKGTLHSMLWERMIHHSIRPDFSDGFVLPYHQALGFAEENPDFDPAAIAAVLPSDRINEFSYAAEHVTNDGAIAALLAAAGSLQASKAKLPGDYDRQL